jgi:hypothetical protein
VHEVRVQKESRMEAAVVGAIGGLVFSLLVMCYSSRNELPVLGGIRYSTTCLDRLCVCRVFPSRPSR